MIRAVVNVATTPRFVRGTTRLRGALDQHSDGLLEGYYYGKEKPSWPRHQQKPYAFKAYALQEAANNGAELLLWCDSCILPIRSMEPLWERIERDGYWIANNGWSNYEWTADSAYPALFPECAASPLALAKAREENRKLPHVVATAFGVNVRHKIGAGILQLYYRLASETDAFCGPWQNANYLGDGWPYAENPPRLMPCGPSDVRGHRHDQTALSVIAWRLGCKLTNSPEIFAYGTGQGPWDERTILVASGDYE